MFGEDASVTGCFKLLDCLEGDALSGKSEISYDMGFDASLCSDEYKENGKLQISALQTLACIKA